MNSFTLRRSPPEVVFVQEDLNEIKEWGAQATDDEIYNQDDLEQFIGTHFTHLSEGLPLGASSAPPANQGKLSAPPISLIVTPSMTRRLDIGSLYRIVPLVPNFVLTVYSALTDCSQATYLPISIFPFPTFIKRKTL